MPSLMTIDMQKWMFRYADRAAQVPLLVSSINKLSVAFAEACLPVFRVHTIHKADPSTWSLLVKSTTVRA